jgi:excisionase family DNA binding protein
MDQLFYRPSEVVRLVSRGRTKVYEALRSGELRSVKAGRSRLIPADALREYAQRIERGEAQV